MSMTHKEALVEAEKAFWWPVVRTEPHTSIDAAIRAYIKARGLVLVQGEPTEEMLDAYWMQTGESNEMRSRTHAYMKRYFRAMLAAAPDPFEDDAA